MNRREFIRSIASVPVLVAPSLSPAPAMKKYGVMTVDSHRAHEAATGEHLLVYFNGCDVTRSCVVADDIKGRVELFCRDRVEHKRWDVDGAVHVGDHGGACRLMLTGDVVMKPRT